MNTVPQRLTNGLLRRPKPPTNPSLDLDLEETLYQRCRSRMERGSISFFAAARLLGSRDHRAIAMLYAWCRYCDDQVDGQNLGHRDSSPQQSLHPNHREPDRHQIVHTLVANTKTMMTDQKAFRAALTQSTFDPALIAMGYLAHHRGLPYFYAEELLKGMSMDLSPPCYRTLTDLKVYGYHVAGVVGVMFSHLVGLSDPQARAQAAELGIAMQLTNIARDIIDDAALGRIYLPRALLERYDLPQEPLEFHNAWSQRCQPPQENLSLHRAVQDLLQEADRLYQRASSGLKYLPWRAAWAAAAARFIYQSIGAQIANKKNQAWETRCSVSTPTKILGIIKAMGLLAKDLPYRMRHPWKIRLSQDSWRYLEL